MNLSAFGAFPGRSARPNARADQALGGQNVALRPYLLRASPRSRVAAFARAAVRDGTCYYPALVPTAAPPPRRGLRPLGTSAAGSSFGARSGVTTKPGHRARGQLQGRFLLRKFWCRVSYFVAAPRARRRDRRPATEHAACAARMERRRPQAMVDTTHELGGGGTRHTSGTGRANGGRVGVWTRSRMCVWVCVGGGVWLCKGIARVFTHATFCWVERDEDGATQLYRTTTPNTSPIPAIRPALLARPVPQPILPGRPLPPRLAAPHNTVHHFDGDVNEHEGRHTYVL